MIDQKQPSQRRMVLMNLQECLLVSKKWLQHFKGLLTMFEENISTSFEEHILSINKIFITLCASNLKIRFNKCQFSELTTQFLGNDVSREGIKPAPSKINIPKI